MNDTFIMINLRMRIFLLFSFLILVTAATEVIYLNDSVTLPSSPSPTLNTTESKTEKDVIIFECGKSNKTVDCECWSETFYCTNYSNPLKSLNIKIFNTESNFTFVRLLVNIDVLKKDKIFPGIEQAIKKIDLDLSKIRIIEDGAFDKFVKLETLSLRYCNLSSINYQIFTKTVGRTLKSLDLHDNSFKTLESNVFQYLTNLTNLDLGKNKIQSSLCKELFPTSLEELNLEFCGISKLEDDVFSNLKNLTVLRLTGNSLTTIPKSIEALSNLNSLEFRFNSITVLGYDGLKILGNLQKLDLSHNENLEFIDTFAFCSFPNLTNLDLSSNKKLKQIHENAFGSFLELFVTKLENLNIANCNLTVLPENLLQWERIKTINVDGNPLECNCSMSWLFNDFVNPKPKYLKSFRGSHPICQSPPELHGQTFQEISGTVCSETNTVIDNRIVVCEKFSHWDSESPCKCADDELICTAFSGDSTFLSLNLKVKNPNFVLKKFTFKYYPIHALKKGQIMRGHESTIEEINLYSNDIEKIENGTFDDFTSLRVLKISGTRIKMFDENILTESLGKRLEELKLGSNFYANISTSALKYMKKLTKLTFDWDFNVPTTLKKEFFSTNLATLKILSLTLYKGQIADDIFDNLVNLEELSFGYSDWITYIPAAINALPNLRILDLNHAEIKNFDTKNLTIIFPKMKKLNMESMYRLKTIENCAFCPFPNLEEIVLEYDHNLEFIHENAFGNINPALNGTKPSKMKKFIASNCDLSTLSENLLPWDTVEKIKAHRNPFICDCSMAWLINDFAKECPKYANNLFPSYYKQFYTCGGPDELKGKNFKQISMQNCSTNFTTPLAILKEDKNCTSELKIPASSKSVNYDYYPSKSNSNTESLIIFAVIIFIVGIIAAIIFGVFYRRKKRINFMNVQAEIDKLNKEMTMSSL